MIELKNVNKKYGEHEVLRNVSLNIADGELAVLTGASGSGKSTLLHLIGGLDQASSGKVIVAGLDLSDENAQKIATFRNSYLGFIFQYHFLLPSMSAMDNILLPARIGGRSLNSVESRVKNYAKHLTIDSLLHKLPQQLSGGEQQRINLLRALSLKPKLLLCDEPTGNLDSKNSHLVVGLIKELCQENQTTCLMVTHDLQMAEYFPRKIAIEDGQIIS